MSAVGVATAAATTPGGGNPGAGPPCSSGAAAPLAPSKTPVISRKRAEVPPHFRNIANPTPHGAVVGNHNNNPIANQNGSQNLMWPGNSERVDLSRRGLTRCPSPANPTSIFLLNLEHNLIRSMDGLSSQLTNLVVLSLYDNQLDKMTGLDGLVSLKLLLLGRNRISKIEGINKLPNLEVLDLHGNQISNSGWSNQQNNTSFGGLKGHPKLRVLNLASNRLSSIDGLMSLPHLIELNLRRNRIRTITDTSVALAGVPRLQRIYLSHNMISRVEDLIALQCVPSLKELGVSNNPVTKQQSMKAYLLDLCPKLQIIDGEQISDQVRTEAAETIRCIQEKARRSAELMVKEDVIDNAKKRWEFLKSEALKMSKCNQRTFHHVLTSAGYGNTQNKQVTEQPGTVAVTGFQHQRKSDLHTKLTNRTSGGKFAAAHSQAAAERSVSPGIKVPLDPDSLETIFPLTAKLSRQNSKIKIPGVTSVQHNGHNLGPARFRPKTAAPAFHPMKPKGTAVAVQSHNQVPGGSRGDSGVNSASSDGSGRPRVQAVPTKIDLSLNPLASSGSNGGSGVGKFKYMKNYVPPMSGQVSNTKLNNVQDNNVEDHAHQGPKTVSSMLKLLSKSDKNEFRAICQKRNTFNRRPNDSLDASSSEYTDESNTESDEEHANDTASEATTNSKELGSNKGSPCGEDPSTLGAEEPAAGAAPAVGVAHEAGGGAVVASVAGSMTFPLGDSAGASLARNPAALPIISTNNKTYKQGKDFVIEIQDGVLSLYGQDSLKYMEAKWISEAAHSVTRAKFQFIQHDDLVTLYPKFRERFPNLVEFHFRETCLDRLGQLNGLATFHKMTSVYISTEGNSIVHHPQWKLYAIYRLGNRGLKVINGCVIEPEDFARATEAFSFLSQLVFSCQTRETILQLYCQVSAMSEPVAGVANGTHAPSSTGTGNQNQETPTGSATGVGSSRHDQQQQQPSSSTSGWTKLSQVESTHPAVLQEAIGREALSYHPLPATRETALLKRSRAMNFMQRVVARYSAATKKLTSMDVHEDRLVRRLVAGALARTLASGVFNDKRF